MLCAVPDWARVLDMDVLSFDAFARSLARVKAADRLEETWGNFIGSQCTKENVQQWTKERFLQVLEVESSARKTGADFVKDLGIVVE